MKFPLNKKVVYTNNSETDFLSSYKDETEIPLLPHPGAFGKKRKHHQHEGVDLYATSGEPVFCIVEGTIIDIFPFTGEIADSPWWNNTYGVLIESEDFVLNYGEIIPSEDIYIGKKIETNDIVGYIEPVLKKDKGRPMAMLHLEMYSKGTTKALESWELNEEQPKELLDPTSLLLEIINS